MIGPPSRSSLLGCAFIGSNTGSVMKHEVMSAYILNTIMTRIVIVARYVHEMDAKTRQKKPSPARTRSSSRSADSCFSCRAIDDDFFLGSTFFSSSPSAGGAAARDGADDEEEKTAI